MTTTAFTYDALAGLRDALKHLDGALYPGTPRRWAERDLTPEQQAHMDRLAMVEREAKERNIAAGIKALGDGKAPLRLDVLDAMADIAVGVVEMESAVCDEFGVTPLERATTAERISRLIGFLDRIALHELLFGHVHAEATRLYRMAQRAIGDAEVVRKLKARCHICDAPSLRAFPERELVICVNGACRCVDEGCGCNLDHPRRHRWPYNQWPWLAEVLSEGIGEAS